MEAVPEQSGRGEVDVSGERHWQRQKEEFSEGPFHKVKITMSNIRKKIVLKKE